MADEFHVQVRKLVIPANKQDAYVYKAGSNGLKRDQSKQHEGIWNAEPRTASQVPLKKNPAKVWIFHYDHLGNSDVPDGILDNNPNQGEFGYTCKHARLVKQPDQVVFFLPKTKLPKGYAPGGVWLYPDYKLENLKELGDGATGFMDMGDKMEKGSKYGVGGGWKMLGMNEKVVSKKREAELEGKQAKTFEIKVRTHKGEVFPLKVPSSTRITKVKEKINAKRGIPIEDQRLSFKNNAMTDNKTLKESGVKNGDTLDLGPMKVYVKNPKGKRFLFEVESDENIADIMEMVEVKEGTPADRQILSFLRRALAPDKTLATYRIKHMNVIDLSVGPPSNKTRVFVEVPEDVGLDDPNGNKLELSVAPTQTFGDIKQVVEDKCGIPKSQQRIFFQDGEVDDNTPVSKAKLKEGDTLTMKPLPPEIQVKTPNGKTRTFIIDPEETVEDFKRRNKKYFPPGNKLLFNDEELVDEEPLAKYKLKKGDVLVSEPEEVEVDTPAGKVLFSLLPTMTPSEIKDVIEEKTGVPKAQQRLFYMDEELEDDKPIGRPKTLPGEGFKMVQLPPDDEPPEVQIKTPDGKVRAFFMDPEETVKDFKEKNKKYFPPGSRLLFNDEEMVDEEPLGKYRMKKGDVLVSEPEEEVYIETPAGKVMFSLLPTMTPSDIKDVIEEKTGVPKSRQRLFYLDNELDEKVPLHKQKTKLPPGSMFAMPDVRFEDDPAQVSPEKVSKRTGAMPEEPEEIEVLLPDRTKILLSVLPTMTVAELEKVVEEKIPEMKKNKQRIFFFDNGEDIDGNTPIRKLDLSVGKPLEVRPYEITIKQRDGRTFQLNADPMDYIDDVKESIEELIGTPSDRLQLSFNGKAVDDTLTLEGQGIHSGAVLVLEPMTIYVDLPNGKQLTILVALDESIKVIKSRVEKKTGYPVEKQCILIGAEELDDSTTLLEANIDDEDVLKMEPFQLKFLHWLGYEFEISDLSQSCTVPALKVLVQEEKLILKEDQCFEFNGKVLNDSETLKEQGVKHKSLLIMQEGEKIEISLPKRKKVSLTVFPTTTLSDIKKVIEEKIPGMATKKQRLFLFDKDDELSDETPLTKLNFDMGKPLELRLFEISVKHWNGETISLNPDPSEYIDDVKEELEELLKIPTDSQRLTHDGKLVDDAITLENQGIEHGSILFLEQMRILVDVPNGKQHRLRAELTDTIKIIKKKIAKKTGHDAKHQSIVFAGEELDDKATLAESNVDHGDVLTMEIYQISIVDSSDGNTFALVDVTRSDTGDTVRERIKTEQDIDVASRRLFFRDRAISDSSSLKDQEIRHKSILVIRAPEDTYELPQGGRMSVSLLKKKSFRDIEDELMMPVEPDWRNRIFIFDSDQTIDDGRISITVMHWSGKNFVFDDVWMREKINDIKRRIPKPKKTSTYRLLLSGKALNDKKKLFEQGVHHKSILIMEEIRKKTLEDLPQADKINFGEGLGAPLGHLAAGEIGINILHWSGQKFRLKLGTTEYPDDIRDAILKVKKIPVDYQHLSFDGNSVDDTLTLKEQGITNGATLSLEQMKIRVELPTKAKLSVKVELNDTMGKVKKRISKHSSYEAHTQCLLFRGELVEDNKTVLDYNMHHRDMLKLESFQVTILRLKGDKLLISDIYSQSRISDLQDVIARKTNVPSAQLQLRVHGKVLEPSRTLASQGILHKAILVLETLTSKSDGSLSVDENKPAVRRTKSSDGDDLLSQSSPLLEAKKKIKRAKSFDASGTNEKSALRGKKPDSKKISGGKKKAKRSNSVDASEANARGREADSREVAEKKKGKRSKSTDATKLGKPVGRMSIDKTKSKTPPDGDDTAEKRGRRPKKGGWWQM